MGHVLLGHARAVGVARVLEEGVRQQVQLIAPREQQPVLVLEVGIHGRALAVAVVDVRYASEGHRIRLRRFALGLLLHVGLVAGPQLHPQLVPCLQLLLEPRPRLQALDDHRVLAPDHPLPKVLGRCGLVGPLVPDLVEALLRARQREARVGAAEGLVRDVGSLVVAPGEEPDVVAQRRLLGHALVLGRELLPGGVGHVYAPLHEVPRRLVLRPDAAVHPVLEGLARLAGGDEGHLSAGGREPAQQLLALGAQQARARLCQDAAAA
mmetsp:Transcript_14298/g.41712  ORF Transcript_14298/g.41712 Transcript_14298/m.41712 type:complete len:266 (+) Transcript_14298:349-1146(+)